MLEFIPHNSTRQDIKLTCVVQVIEVPKNKCQDRERTKLAYKNGSYLAIKSVAADGETPSPMPT